MQMQNYQGFAVISLYSIRYFKCQEKYDKEYSIAAFFFLEFHCLCERSLKKIYILYFFSLKNKDKKVNSLFYFFFLYKINISTTTKTV